MPYELHLALRYLRFHRGRTFISLITLISVGGVTVGTAALVIALSLMNGFVTDFRARILNGTAHLQIMHVFDETTPRLWGALEKARAVPGVEAVSAVLFTHSMAVGAAGRQAYSEIYGVLPDSQADVLGADEETRAVLERLDRPTVSGREPIVLGEKLAQRLGVGLGDAVRLVVPKVTLSPFAPIPRNRSFEVVGTYTSVNFEQDAQRAFIPLEAADALLSAGGALSHVEVRIRDLDRLDAVKDELREALGGSEWHVFDLIEFNQVFIKAFNEEKLYLFLAIWLIVVVAALNIVSTLVLMVMDKVKDIGTLSAMGAKPLGIALTFFLQGTIIGILGAVLGITLGSFLASWADRLQLFPLDPEVYYLSHVRFVVQASDLLKAAAMSLGTSLIATLYPAWRAARLDPVEALRYE
jgi:lipoprotein-releasing system permease protein